MHGSPVQFFLDDLLIETVHEVTRRFHQPVKSGRNPVISTDKPWESIAYFLCNTWKVLRDPHDGLFKCWYADYRIDPAAWKRIGHFKTPDVYSIRVCHATSKDGRHWDKPGLGVVTENGRDTNVVYGGGDLGTINSVSVLINPDPQDESKRYMAIHFQHKPGYMGNMVSYSPDGVHWRPADESPTFGDAAMVGDVLMPCYRSSTRQFVASVRHDYMSTVQQNPRTPEGGGFLAFEPYCPHDFGKMNKRMIWQIESGDFLHWTQPHLILAPRDDFDNVDDEFYGMTPYPMGNLSLGFLNVFHKTDNTMDVQLVYSRDGQAWHRLNKAHTWLTRGAQDSWDRYMVDITSPPVQVGDELYIYYGGFKCHHDWWRSGLLEGLSVPEANDLSMAQSGLGLARLRLDGFASLDASQAREGMVITRPFISDGEMLIINARADKGGYIAVEVVDGADKPIPGCSRSECDQFTGDDVRHVLTWQGSSTVPKAGDNQFRKLRFFMHKASLYSFQMTASAKRDRRTKFPGVGWETDA